VPRATRLLARRGNDLTPGEFDEPFANLLVRHAFAGIELGLGFGDGRGFLGGIDLLENGFRLGHVTLRFGVPIIREFGCK
jgi:hypothetical protein